MNFNGQKYSVTTRHNYIDPRDKRPSRQSCYVTYFGFLYELSEKKGEGSVLPVTVEQLDVANAMGINNSDLPYFNKYCKYI